MQTPSKRSLTDRPEGRSLTSCLVDFDVTVQQALQKLRTPLLDGGMVALTALGDAAVVLPLLIAAVARFVWHRLRQTSLSWLLAAGMAELLVKV